MAVCAAYNSQHSQDAGALGLGIVTLGLLGTLGNVVCCLTSIVLFMPTLSILEGVHTRSELEIIAFCKLAFFQTMGVVLSTLCVPPPSLALDPITHAHVPRNARQARHAHHTRRAARFRCLSLCVGAGRAKPLAAVRSIAVARLCLSAASAPAADGLARTVPSAPPRGCNLVQVCLLAR